MAQGTEHEAPAGGRPLRVQMFVYNACRTDARVLKEATTLAEAGHEVVIYAVKDRDSALRETRDGFEIARIERDPLHYRLFRRSSQVRRGVRRGRALARRTVRQTRRRARLAVRRVRRAATWPLRRARYLSSRVLGSRQAAAAPEPPVADIGGELFDIPDQVPPTLAGPAATTPARTRSLPRRVAMRFHKPLMFGDYYARAYRAALGDGGADVIHAHDLNTLPVAFALARKTGAHLVYDSHELYTQVSGISRLERRVWRVLERAMIGGADDVVTVCESIAGELQRRYGIRPPSVVLNAPPRVKLPDEPSPLHDKVGLDPGVPIVLYQGGFSRHRGLETLVEAARGFERGALVLMGWGKLEEELRELVARHDLAERVRITPPVAQHELLRYTSGAAVGVIPYHAVGLNNYYTTPNKLFEYIGAGVPVTGSRFPELIRFIEGYEIGRTFDPTDAADMAAAINWTLADDERLAALRARTRQVAPELSWERQAPKLLAIYERAGAGRMPAS